MITVNFQIIYYFYIEIFYNQIYYISPFITIYQHSTEDYKIYYHKYILHMNLYYICNINSCNYF